MAGSVSLAAEVKAFKPNSDAHRVLAYALVTANGCYFAGYARGRGKARVEPSLADAKLFTPQDLLTVVPGHLTRLKAMDRPARLARIVLQGV